MLLVRGQEPAEVGLDAGVGVGLAGQELHGGEGVLVVVEGDDVGATAQRHLPELVGDRGQVEGVHVTVGTELDVRVGVGEVGGVEVGLAVHAARAVGDREPRLGEAG